MPQLRSGFGSSSVFSFLFQQPLPVLTPLSQNLMDYSLAVSYFCSQL